MATYLIYHRAGQSGGNSTRRNTVIASGANETAARAAANAARPDGETTVAPSWSAQLLSANDNVAAPIWIQGYVAEPLQPAKGR